MIIEIFDSNWCLGSNEFVHQQKTIVQLPHPIFNKLPYPWATPNDENPIQSEQDVLNHYCLWGVYEHMNSEYMKNNITYYQPLGNTFEHHQEYDMNRDPSNLDFYYGNKEEMYLRLLIGYKYETVTYYDVTREKEITEYKWGYENCGKLLQKPWNLLDHVRMHEGVKPYLCQWWGKGFTQKGNLKKHARQHVNPDVNDRKRYSCRFCGKGYTERYNLKVLLITCCSTKFYSNWAQCRLHIFNHFHEQNIVLGIFHWTFAYSSTFIITLDINYIYLFWLLLFLCRANIYLLEQMFISIVKYAIFSISELQVLKIKLNNNF